MENTDSMMLNDVLEQAEFYFEDWPSIEVQKKAFSSGCIPVLVNNEEWLLSVAGSLMLGKDTRPMIKIVNDDLNIDVVVEASGYPVFAVMVYNYI